MSQCFFAPEEFGHALTGMKSHQCRDILLRIDEILSVLDTASPAMRQWKAARRFIQTMGGSKFTAMAGASYEGSAPERR